MHWKPCQGEKILKISIEIQRDCHIFLVRFFCSFCLGFFSFLSSWVHLLFWGLFWYGFSDNSCFENKPEKAKHFRKARHCSCFSPPAPKEKQKSWFWNKAFPNNSYTNISMVISLLFCRGSLESLVPKEVLASIVLHPFLWFSNFSKVVLRKWWIWSGWSNPGKSSQGRPKKLNFGILMQYRRPNDRY